MPRLSAVQTCLIMLVVVPQASLAAFVPAVPAVGADLHSSPTSVDQTMVYYMAGYAVSMAAAGAISARLGPRSTQLAALGLHVAASVAVIASRDVSMLAVARFAQALGGGAGTVLSRTYVQELLPEKERLPALTGLSTAIALTPAITPPVAGLLLSAVSWRIVLASLVVLSAFTLVLAYRVLPRHAPGGLQQSQPLRAVLRRTDYWHYVAVISAAWCAYFTFTTFSSHTLQIHLGVSSTVFSLLYALVVLGYVAGSRAARRYSAAFPLGRVLRWSGATAAVATAAMIGLTAVAPDQPLALVGPMAVAMIGVGAAFPLSQAGMLRVVGTGARSASGLFFFLQMTSGTLYTGVLSLLDPTPPQKLALVVLIPAVVLGGLVLRSRPEASPAAAAECRPSDDPAQSRESQVVETGR
jgi:DHA1 family bicyclomycin/chloramphenicol resistance-like MFS transporter